MFSKKATAVLILTATSLALYIHKDEEREILSFPPSILDKEKILNWDKFTLLVEEFLARNSLKKQHAIMILGKDVLFERSFPKDEEISNEEEEKFLKKVPYEKEMLVVKKLQDDEKTYLLATHKDFYSSVKYTLEKFGWSIDMVVPATMFDGFDSSKQLSFDEVRQILENVEDLAIGDFLSNTGELRRSRIKDKDIVPKKSGGFFRKQNVFFFLGLTVACAIVVFLLLFFNIIKSPMPGGTETATVTPTPVVKATPTPEGMAKDKVKVSILNGTGTAGQAGKVKDVLTDLGYKEMTTDNADSTGNTETTVAVSEKVSTKLRDEIVTELKKTFETVVTKINTDASSDIVITTGSEK